MELESIVGRERVNPSDFFLKRKSMDNLEHSLFFVSHADEKTAVFSEEERHHALSVLRKDPSGFIHATDGKGTIYTCLLREGTAQAEVAFHYAEGLREVNWQEEETVAYREYLADFLPDLIIFSHTVKSVCWLVFIAI